VALEPEPCGCGAPFPVLRVEGRRDEALVLTAADGKRVTLLPLAVTTVVEEHAGAHQFQIIQAAPDSLEVRLETPRGASPVALWRKVKHALRAYLDAHGLPAVTLHFVPGPLQRSGRSGKVQRVVAAHPD
jgi:hypothetical protein